MLGALFNDSSMQIDVQKLEKSEVKLVIKLSAEEMKAYEEKAAEELQGQVKIDGFRAGHVPLDVLKEHVGDQGFLGATMDIAIGDAYEKAVHEKELRPVSYPKINITSHEPLLEFEAVVALLPEVKFKKDPTKLTVKRKKAVVEDKEVHEVIENFMERSKKWTDVTRAAQKGDRVEIDFDGFDEGGAPLDGTASKNHPVVLGSNSLIPGFEDEVVGMSIADEKDFWITFPKDYHSKVFQSKKVRFHIKLNRVEEGQKQEANDDWAKEVSGDKEKNLVSMKEDIKVELTKQKGHQEESRLEEEFLKVLMEHVEAEVPDALVEREIEFMVKRLKEDMEKQKRNWEEYEKELKEQGKDLHKELHKPAAEQVLIRLGLEKLMEMEKPEVSEEDIQEEISRLLGNYPPEFQAMLKERYAEGTEGRETVKGAARFKKLIRGHTED